MLFGPQPDITPQDLVTSFVHLVAERNILSQREQTTSIKDALRTIGERCGYYVAATPGPEPEFLFDLVWFKSSQANDIVMAAESELEKKEVKIWQDFQKLLHVKAPLKLLVFQGAESDWAPKILGGIHQRYFEKFSQQVSGERYIFVEFLFEKKEAHWWQLDVLADGPIKGDFERKGKLHLTRQPSSCGEGA